jgi:phosphoglycolate phosphatase
MNGRHTTVYPGVRDGLAKLADERIPLACVTNKSTRFALPLLELVGFSKYFEHVVGGDTVARKKPHPAPLLHACAAFMIAPREMLMIGDSVNDTQAARAAGCPVFCVPYGYNEGRDVHTLDSDAVVGTLREAAELVCKA